MDAKNWNRLEKLINLTSSDNDHEAISSLRNAQKLTHGNLWKVLTKGATVSSSSSSDTREMNSLRMRLHSAELLNDKLAKELREAERKLRQKPPAAATSKEGFDLRPHLSKPGYFEVYYELSLEKWVRTLALVQSSSPTDWVAVAELKKQFEKAIGSDFDKISTKKFSQFFAEILDMKSSKGGASKDIKGFKVKVS